MLIGNKSRNHENNKIKKSYFSVADLMYYMLSTRTAQLWNLDSIITNIYT